MAKVVCVLGLSPDSGLLCAGRRDAARPEHCTGAYLELFDLPLISSETPFLYSSSVSYLSEPRTGPHARYHLRRSILPRNLGPLANVARKPHPGAKRWRSRIVFYSRGGMTKLFPLETRSKRIALGGCA
jgi:hypothetical protein